MFHREYNKGTGKQSKVVWGVMFSLLGAAGLANAAITVPAGYRTVYVGELDGDGEQNDLFFRADNNYVLSYRQGPYGLDVIPYIQAPDLLVHVDSNKTPRYEYWPAITRFKDWSELTSGYNFVYADSDADDVDELVIVSEDADNPSIYFPVSDVKYNTGQKYARRIPLISGVPATDYSFGNFDGDATDGDELKIKIDGVDVIFQASADGSWLYPLMATSGTTDTDFKKKFQLLDRLSFGATPDLLKTAGETTYSSFRSDFFTAPTDNEEYRLAIANWLANDVFATEYWRKHEDPIDPTIKYDVYWTNPTSVWSSLTHAVEAESNGSGGFTFYRSNSSDDSDLHWVVVNGGAVETSQSASDQLVFDYTPASAGTYTVHLAKTGALLTKVSNSVKFVKDETDYFVNDDTDAKLKVSSVVERVFSRKFAEEMYDLPSDFGIPSGYGSFVTISVSGAMHTNLEEFQLLSMVHNQHHLQEVMAWFWENHFNTRGADTLSGAANADFIEAMESALALNPSLVTTYGTMDNPTLDVAKTSHNNDSEVSHYEAHVYYDHLDWTAGTAGINKLELTASGSGYGTGTYSSVALTGGSGSGATADIVVDATGNVSSVSLDARGSSYYMNDLLSAAAVDLGGSGSGLQIKVTSFGDLDMCDTSCPPDKEKADLEQRRLRALNKGRFVQDEYRDNQAFREQALGDFKDILLASVESPAMMIYLHNDHNRAKFDGSGTCLPNSVTPPNEDYGRELLELHTVGAIADYSEGVGGDIEQVSQILTGWIAQKGGDRDDVTQNAFAFDSDIHDCYESVDIGSDGSNEFDAFQSDEWDDHKADSIFWNTSGALHTSSQYGSFTQGGKTEGLAVLEFIASSPYTARFICGKLGQVFVTDNILDTGTFDWSAYAALGYKEPTGGYDKYIPPVEACVTSYMSTGASKRNIGDAINAMVSHADYEDYARDKIKTPMEVAVTYVRNIKRNWVDAGKPIDFADLAGSIQRMGLNQFDNPVPTGFSESGSSWLSVGDLKNRFAVIVDGMNTKRGDNPFNVGIRDSSGTTQLIDERYGYTEFFRMLGAYTGGDIYQIVSELALAKRLVDSNGNPISGVNNDGIRQVAVDAQLLDFDLSDSNAEDKVTKLLQFMYNLPSYQYQ